MWTETPTGGTVNFITGAGGFLQTVLNGALGLGLTASALVLDPAPLAVSAAASVGARVAWRGRRVAVTVRDEELTVRLLDGRPLEVAGQLLPRGAARSMPRERVEVREAPAIAYV